jgi:hypothetical protein
VQPYGKYGFLRIALLFQPMHSGTSMFRLDYISCLLTIASTILVGRRMWQGWIIAGANSLIICFIGLRTTQLGFIPANLFCLVIYIHNIARWRNPLPLSEPAAPNAVEHCGKT